MDGYDKEKFTEKASKAISEMSDDEIRKEYDLVNRHLGTKQLALDELITKLARLHKELSENKIAIGIYQAEAEKRGIEI